MAIFTTPDSDTKFLMHTDETNGTLTFTDYSANGYTITNQGTQVDHAAGFGGMKFLPTLESAAYFGGGTNSFLVVDNTTIGDFGNDVYSGAFTIDLWLQLTAIHAADSGTREGVFSRRGSGQSSTTDGGWFVDVWGSQIHLGGNFDGGWHDGGEGIECAYPTDALFHHVAIVRTGYPSGLYQIYIDGVRGVSWQSGTGNQMQGRASDKFCIGNNSFEDEDTTDFNGGMEEIRISHVARWVDNFTPPNKPYSVISDDSVTDIAGIEDEANITTVGTGLVVKSDPGEASTDSVFSASAKDGTVLLDIDARGSITKPRHPAISGQAGAGAVLTGDANFMNYAPGDGSGVPSTNRGITYANADAGWTQTYANREHFVVPVAGAYFTHYTNAANGSSVDTNVRINLHINTTQVQRLDWVYGHTDWGQFTSTAIVNLSANDQISWSLDCRGSNTQNTDGGVWGYFSIYLIG